MSFSFDDDLPDENDDLPDENDEFSDDDFFALREQSLLDKTEIINSTFDSDEDDDLPDDDTPVDLSRSPADVYMDTNIDVEEEVVEIVEDDDDDDEDDFESILALRDGGVVEQPESDSERVSSGGGVVDSDLDAILSRASLDPSEGYFDEDDDDEEDDPYAHIKIDEILAFGIDKGASDVHIKPDAPVWLTINKKVSSYNDFGVIPVSVVERFLTEIVSNVKRREFAQNRGADTAYVINSGRHRGVRTRLNIAHTSDAPDMTFRIINSKIPTPEAIGVHPYLLEWVKRASGMVLVCGATGSGKSTTFASIVNEVLRRDPKKIVSLENPIEYVFDDSAGLIVQRELGTDLRTFADGIKGALRQHPQMIMVGEIRDRSEVDEFLRAAESGHFSMSTMHVDSPETAITRIIAQYSGEERQTVLTSLNEQLIGVVNQVLVPSKKNGNLISVSCALPVVDEIRPMILKGDTWSIKQYMIRNGLTMEHALANAVRKNDCTLQVAASYAPNLELFNKIMRGES